MKMSQRIRLERARRRAEREQPAAWERLRERLLYPRTWLDRLVIRKLRKSAKLPG